MFGLSRYLKQVTSHVGKIKKAKSFIKYKAIEKILIPVNEQTLNKLSHNSFSNLQIQETIDQTTKNPFLNLKTENPKSYLQSEYFSLEENENILKYSQNQNPQNNSNKNPDNTNSNNTGPRKDVPNSERKPPFRNPSERWDYFLDFKIRNNLAGVNYQNYNYFSTFKKGIKMLFTNDPNQARTLMKDFLCIIMTPLEGRPIPEGFNKYFIERIWILEQLEDELKNLKAARDIKKNIDNQNWAFLELIYIVKFHLDLTMLSSKQIKMRFQDPDLIQLKEEVENMTKEEFEQQILMALGYGIKLAPNKSKFTFEKSVYGTESTEQENIIQMEPENKVDPSPKETSKSKSNQENEADSIPPEISSHHVSEITFNESFIEKMISDYELILKNYKELYNKTLLINQQVQLEFENAKFKENLREYLENNSIDEQSVEEKVIQISKFSILTQSIIDDLKKNSSIENNYSQMTFLIKELLKIQNNHHSRDFKFMSSLFKIHYSLIIQIYSVLIKDCNLQKHKLIQNKSKSNEDMIENIIQNPTFSFLESDDIRNLLFQNKIQKYDRKHFEMIFFEFLEDQIDEDQNHLIYILYFNLENSVTKNDYKKKLGQFEKIIEDENLNSIKEFSSLELLEKNIQEIKQCIENKESIFKLKESKESSIYDFELELYSWLINNSEEEILEKMRELVRVMKERSQIQSLLVKFNLIRLNSKIELNLQKNAESFTSLKTETENFLKTARDKHLLRKKTKNIFKYRKRNNLKDLETFTKIISQDSDNLALAFFIDSQKEAMNTSIEEMKELRENIFQISALILTIMEVDVYPKKIDENVKNNLLRVIAMQRLHGLKSTLHDKMFKNIDFPIDLSSNDQKNENPDESNQNIKNEKDGKQEEQKEDNDKKQKQIRKILELIYSFLLYVLIFRIINIFSQTIKNNEHKENEKTKLPPFDSSKQNPIDFSVTNDKQQKPENLKIPITWRYIDYLTFIDLLKKKEINKIIIDPDMLNFNQEASKGLLTIKLEGDNFDAKFLVSNINGFIQNLENFQREDLKWKESEFVKLEFIRPYNEKKDYFSLLSTAIVTGIFVFGAFRLSQKRKNLTSLITDSFTQSKKNFLQKKFRSDKLKVKFDHVLGCDSAKDEIQEIVKFLESPEDFTKAGARQPKGALLSGPPGTGKTLLAKAAASEANVPFFYISGSEFVNKYVGVGAATVRDLFSQAKEHAPSLVFIDEVDAIGIKRGVDFGGNSERETTLNQLLVEMDGFNSNDQVIVIAATNRPEALDSALKRPGRFDRQIRVDLPSLKGRVDILKMYLNQIRLKGFQEIITNENTEEKKNTDNSTIKQMKNKINEELQSNLKNKFKKEKKTDENTGKEIPKKSENDISKNIQVTNFKTASEIKKEIKEYKNVFLKLFRRDMMKFMDKIIQKLPGTKFSILYSNEIRGYIKKEKMRKKQKLRSGKKFTNNSENLNQLAERLATLSPNFSGADLKNLTNEAAILAARNNQDFATSADFEEASERILGGLKSPLKLDDEIKRMVAVHESGHAVAAWFSKGADPLVKVTIIPRSKGSLGFAQYLTSDEIIKTKRQIEDQLVFILGGRIAEEIFIGAISNGAHDDLEKAFEIARSYVSDFGMSEREPEKNESFNDGTRPNLQSEMTQEAIDEEIFKLIEKSTERCRELLNAKKEMVESLSQNLIEKETLDLDSLLEILGPRPDYEDTSGNRFIQDYIKNHWKNNPNNFIPDTEEI